MRKHFFITTFFLFSLSSLFITTTHIASSEKTNSFGSNKTYIAPAANHCTKDEQMIWSCTIKKTLKIASVCASKNLDSSEGYVQYRFGKAGKVEFEFPVAKEDTQSKFTYSRYTRPLVTMLSLRFENNGYNYEIHDDSNAEEKPAINVASIETQTSEGKQVELVCLQPTRGSLMKLEDIVPKE